MNSHDAVDYSGYAIDRIFEPSTIGDDGVWQYAAMDALVFFAREFASVCGESPDVLQFDFIGMWEMFNRHGRDAWGVKRFHSRTHSILTAIGVPEETFKTIVAELDRVGIRVNTINPRKTRIAAVLTLWMATFRPICLRSDAKLNDPKLATTFCAEFTFALCCMYLECFGEVVYGSTEKDATTRIQHVIHDLLCRSVSYSPLEMLYCGIFRPSES